MPSYNGKCLCGAVEWKVQSDSDQVNPQDLRNRLLAIVQVDATVILTQLENL